MKAFWSICIGLGLWGLGLAQQLPASVSVLGFTAPDGASQDALTLTTLLPQTLYAVLQRQGVAQVDVQPVPTLPALEAATIGLAQGTQVVIGGSLTPLSGNLVITAYRYQTVEGSTQVVRTAVLTTGSPYDPEVLARKILSQLFPRSLSDLQPQVAAQIVLQPSTLNLPVGGTHKLEALVLSSSGTPIPKAQVMFQSTNPSVVQVDANGQILALSPGQATVEADVLGLSGSSALSARTKINVAAPYLGLRAGYGVIGAGLSGGVEFGVRLTPQSAFTPPDLPQASSSSGDVLSIVGSFVGKIISGGNVSLGLEFFQGATALTLTTTQWAGQNYLGTGLIYLPGFSGGNATLGLDFYLGRELFVPSQASLPLELEFQLLFPSMGPQIKLSLMAGLDVFQ